MAAVGAQIRTGDRPSGMSRLAMMQERMRENIRQEKESRMLEMVARREAEREDVISRVTKSSVSSLSSSMNSSFTAGGQGRVRKMLEERRNNQNTKGYVSPKGFDKSYPLDPVKKDGTKPQSNGYLQRGTSNDRLASNSKSYISMPRSRSQVAMDRNKNNKTSNSNSSFEGLKLNNYHKSTSSLLDRRSSPIPAPTSTRSSPGQRNTYNGTPWKPPPRPGQMASKPLPPAPKKAPLAPAPKKAPIAPAPKPPPRKFGLKAMPDPSETDYKPAPKPTPKTNGFVKKAAPAPVRQPPKKAPNIQMKPKEVPKEVVQARKNDGMPACEICGRTFASDRIEKHKQICAKSKSKAKKRKVFDPTKMRTEGTDAERYVKRGLHKKEPPKKKGDWRKKHEQLIQTLRAAKGVKGYQAPPVDTSDYVTCPHCGRKFNEAAADRHIPKCANIQSNKKRR